MLVNHFLEHLRFCKGTKKSKGEDMITYAEVMVGWSGVRLFDLPLFSFEPSNTSLDSHNTFLPSPAPHQLALVETALFAGWFVGATICSLISDRVGRRPVVVATGLAMAAALAAQACLPGDATRGTLPVPTGTVTRADGETTESVVWAYVLLRLVLGFAVGGNGLSAFVLAVEHFGPSLERRHGTVSVLFNVQWSLGAAFLVALTLALPHWRPTHIAVSVACAIVAAAVVLGGVNESAQWKENKELAKAGARGSPTLDDSATTAVLEYHSHTLRRPGTRSEVIEGSVARNHARKTSDEASFSAVSSHSVPRSLRIPRSRRLDTSNNSSASAHSFHTLRAGRHSSPRRAPLDASIFVRSSVNGYQKLSPDTTHHDDPSLARPSSPSPSGDSRSSRESHDDDSYPDGHAVLRVMPSQHLVADEWGTAANGTVRTLTERKYLIRLALLCYVWGAIAMLFYGEQWVKGTILQHIYKAHLLQGVALDTTNLTSSPNVPSEPTPGTKPPPPTLTIDIYSLNALLSLAAIPAQLLAAPTLRWLGARHTLAWGFALSSFLFAVAASVALWGARAATEGEPATISGVPLATAVSLLTLPSYFVVSLVYTTLYSFTSTSFPTEVRNTAIGIAQTASKIGATVAPLVVHAGSGSGEGNTSDEALWVPLVVFAVAGFFACGTVAAIPEDRGNSKGSGGSDEVVVDDRSSSRVEQSRVVEETGGDGDTADDESEEATFMGNAKTFLEKV
ncbi:hypothetical protein HDU93_004494 [Gonapodya sp. JEL0774]|nr:hypothetical protein HDU93_004494 [Gonapodya sp. JEL0774]